MIRSSQKRRPANALRERRQFVTLGGVTLLATTVLGATGCASALTKAGLSPFPRAEPGPFSPQTVAGVPVGTLGGGTKPIFVAPPGNLDPVVHSVADTLFWGEQLMEHAMFIAMMMPGQELAAQRAEAERFHRQFLEHLTRLRGSRLDRANYVTFNRETIALANALSDYKQRMHDAQARGRMRSLGWPSFYDHIRNESVRFTARLVQLNTGNATFNRQEVIPFWADKMEEHSLFIAHMLDPDEKVLISASEASAKLFGKMEASPPDKDPALAAVQTIIDFKTAAEKGILAGEIKSIIHPALADHVRREAVRFKDELARST